MISFPIKINLSAGDRDQIGFNLVQPAQIWGIFKLGLLILW